MRLKKIRASETESERETTREMKHTSASQKKKTHHHLLVSLAGGTKIKPESDLENTED